VHTPCKRLRWAVRKKKHACMHNYLLLYSRTDLLLYYVLLVAPCLSFNCKLLLLLLLDALFNSCQSSISPVANNCYCLSYICLLSPVQVSKHVWMHCPSHSFLHKGKFAPASCRRKAALDITRHHSPFWLQLTSPRGPRNPITTIFVLSSGPLDHIPLYSCQATFPLSK
jgi:hypothetical protein